MYFVKSVAQNFLPILVMATCLIVPDAVGIFLSGMGFLGATMMLKFPHK